MERSRLYAITGTHIFNVVLIFKIEKVNSLIFFYKLKYDFTISIVVLAKSNASLAPFY